MTNRADGDFIDFNCVIDRPEASRLYMKVEVVEEAAKLLGMVPARKLAELEARLEEMSTELADIQDTMRIAAEFEEKFGKERIAA